MAAADHAYYSKQVVEFLTKELDWDCTIGVTDPNRRRGGRLDDALPGFTAGHLRTFPSSSKHLDRTPTSWNPASGAAKPIPPVNLLQRRPKTDSANGLRGRRAMPARSAPHPLRSRSVPGLQSIGFLYIMTPAPTRERRPA